MMRKFFLKYPPDSVRAWLRTTPNTWVPANRTAFAILINRPRSSCPAWTTKTQASTAGLRQRIDYVAVDEMMAERVVNDAVSEDLLTLGEADDHWPVTNEQ